MSEMTVIVDYPYVMVVTDATRVFAISTPDVTDVIRRALAIKFWYKVEVDIPLLARAMGCKEVRLPKKTIRYLTTLNRGKEVRFEDA